MAHDQSGRDSITGGTRVLLGAVSTLAISLGVIVTSSAAVNDHPPAAPSPQEAIARAAAVGAPGERVAAIYMKYGSRGHKTQGHALKLESRQHKTRANYGKIEWERRHGNQGVGWSWASHQHKTQGHFLKIDKPHKQK